MTTTTKTDTPTDTTNFVDEAEHAAEHAEAASLAVIRPEQQRFDENQRAILRQLGIEDATDGDLDLFFHVCRTTGLDPFRKQIYMIGRNTKIKEWVDDDRATNGRRQIEKWVTKYTIQTGIDGYRRNIREAAKTLGDELRFEGPYFTGEDDFHITDDGEVIQHWRKVWPGRKAPHAARFVIWRNGEPFEGIAHYDEFVQYGYQQEPNSMWSKMPRNQLAKCAEGLASRRAYPDDLSGLILEDSAQPTVIDGNTGEIIREGRPAQPPRPVPVTVDQIFADEVPLPDPEPSREDLIRHRDQQLARIDEQAAHRDDAAPETPAGDEPQAVGQAARADIPSPAAPEPAPADIAEAVGFAADPVVEAEPSAKATSKKTAAKRSTAPTADPDRPKSKMRAALEKRHFVLIGDAGLSADKDRDGRMAVYRAILERPDIASADDLDDVALTKVSDQLYVWQQQKELDDQIAGILMDAARDESESAAPVADPTSEGN